MCLRKYHYLTNPACVSAGTSWAPTSAGARRKESEFGGVLAEEYGLPLKTFNLDS